MSKTVEDVLDALLKLFHGQSCLLHEFYVPPGSIIPYAPVVAPSISTG
jgi:hypothetical protein